MPIFQPRRFIASLLARASPQASGTHPLLGDRLVRTSLNLTRLSQGRKTSGLRWMRAVVPAHLKTPGVHVGRMSAKANGSFTIATPKGSVPGIGKKYYRQLQQADGYGYQ